jgi:TM2 domain-containing membrane protein YozV
VFLKNAEREIVNEAKTGLEPKDKERFLRDYSIMKNSEWITFWLCLFLGTLGAHQFYLRNNARGSLYFVLCIILIIVTQISNSTLVVVLVAIGETILFGLVFVDLMTFIRITNDANRKIVDVIMTRISFKNSILYKGNPVPTFDELIIMNATRGMKENEIIKFKLEYYTKRKSEWVTFWLCLLLGGIGIHQFYLRNYPKGWLFVVLSSLIVLLMLSAKQSGAYIIYVILLLSICISIFYDLCTFIKITKEYNSTVADSILASMNKSRSNKETITTTF